MKIPQGFWRLWRARGELDAATEARLHALEQAITEKTAALAQARYEDSRNRIARAMALSEAWENRNWADIESDPVDSLATQPEPCGIVADENCHPVKINWPKPFSTSQELANIVQAARQRIAEEHAVRFDLTPMDLQYLMEMEQAFQKGGTYEPVS